jgi:hypothetical protein
MPEQSRYNVSCNGNNFGDFQITKISECGIIDSGNQNMNNINILQYEQYINNNMNYPKFEPESRTHGSSTLSGSKMADFWR